MRGRSASRDFYSKIQRAAEKLRRQRSSAGSGWTGGDTSEISRTAACPHRDAWPSDKIKPQHCHLQCSLGAEHQAKLFSPMTSVYNFFQNQSKMNTFVSTGSAPVWFQLERL